MVGGTHTTHTHTRTFAAAAETRRIINLGWARTSLSAGFNKTIQIMYLDCLATPQQPGGGAWRRTSRRTRWKTWREMKIRTMMKTRCRTEIRTGRKIERKRTRRRTERRTQRRSRRNTRRTIKRMD